MPIAEKRKAALDKFELAKQADRFTAWKDAAVSLAAVMPRPRQPKGCRYPYPIAVALFADGVTVRMGFYSLKGKPLDWDRALRLVKSAYQCKAAVAACKKSDWFVFFDAVKAEIRVPEIVSLVEEISGEVAIPAMNEAA